MLATGSLKQLHVNCSGIWRIVRRYPSTLLWPLLVLGVVLGLGVWGVVRIGQVEESSAKSRAASLALDTATWFSQQLSVAIAPVQLMSAMVKYDPQYDAVVQLFNGLAPALLEQDPLRSIKMLEYVPLGVVADIYPLVGNNGAATGVDLFNTTDREGALKTVRDRALTLVGPLLFFQGGRGVIVREPIFVAGVEPGETFGITHPLNPYCGQPCAYDAASRSKFWGFAAGLIDLDRLSQAQDSKLHVLEDMGYRYEVQALGGMAAYEMGVVAASSKPVQQPVEALISLPNTQWVVRVSPEGGWRSGSSGNARGLFVAVAVVAVALSLLLLAALVSRKRHQMLLEALLPKELLRDLHGTDTTLLDCPPILQAETTADLMLSMLARLLEGYMPDLRDVVFIRQAIIRGVDLYQPTDLNKHIRSANLDTDVARSLMQQLGSPFVTAPFYDAPMHPYDADCRSKRPTPSAASLSLLPQQHPHQHKNQTQNQNQDCSTLTGALKFILTPQPVGWRDTVVTAEQLMAGATEGLQQPMTREIEPCNPWSPRGSAYSGVAMVRAISLHRDGGVGAAATLSPFTSVGAGAVAAGVNGACTGIDAGAVPVSFGLFGSSRRRARSVELVREEEGELQHRHSQPRDLQQQQQQQHHHDKHEPQQQLQVIDGQQRLKPVKATLLFSQALRETPLRYNNSNRCSGGSAGSGGVGDGVGGGKCAVLGESETRLTLNPAASNALDDAVLSTGTFSMVRQLPRRVASAINILGRPINAPRRNSLVLATSAVKPELALERRPGLAITAASPGGCCSVSGRASGSGGVAAAHVRRSSVASVPEVPPDCEAADLTGSGSGPGKELVGVGVGVCAGRVAMAQAGGVAGGCSSIRRSQPGGLSRLVAVQRAAIHTSPPPPPPPPPPPLVEEVERVLAQADSWQFDTWRLRDVTNGHPLSALGFYLFHRAGLISHFNLKPAVLARLLRHIESGYPDNPYHNATHAADVLQTLHVIVHGAQLHVHYVDQLGLMAAYWAAIVHDYGHPGLTNDFLVATSDPLAVRYNDRSPLENHHAAASFDLLQRPDLDVLSPLSKSQRAAFRKQVIELVLATDMKQHFSLLSQFNTAHRLAGFVKETYSCNTNSNGSCTNAEVLFNRSGPSSQRPPGNTTATTTNINNTITELSDVIVDSYQQMVVDTGADCKHLAPKPLDDTERLLSLQLVIKAADLGHLGEELEVHQRWLAGLEEEFFRQGDRERSLGLPISPLFDRAKQGVSKSQVGFYDFVALPLVHALCGAFPGARKLMRCFLGNYNHWRAIEGQAPVAMPDMRKEVMAPVPQPPPPPAPSKVTTATPPPPEQERLDK